MSRKRLKAKKWLEQEGWDVWEVGSNFKIPRKGKSFYYVVEKRITTNYDPRKLAVYMKAVREGHKDRYSGFDYSKVALVYDDGEFKLIRVEER